MTRWRYGWLVGWLLMFLSPAVIAQTTLQLINSQQTVRLTNQLRVYYEPHGELSLNEVMSRSDDFAFSAGENPNYGLADHGVWLMMPFSNVTDSSQWVIDVGFPQLDKLDMYLVIDGEVYASTHQGKLRQNQLYRFPSLDATLPFATTVELFVRAENAGNSLIVPVDVQSKATHTRTMVLDNLLWGLFYGGLLILAIYNLVLYLGNRESSLLAYVGYISTVIFWQFVWGGHLNLLLANNFALWMSAHLDLIFVIIGIGSGIFTYTFLDAPHTAPRLTPMIRASIILLAGFGILSVLEVLPHLWQLGLVYGVSLLAITSYLIAGFESYFNHFKPARYFIFAWSILACCALIGMLSLVGVFPSNFFTTYCFQFGVFLEAGLFSLALMDKSKSQLEQEVQQATRDLRNNMEFIEEQNARLDIARKDAIKASHVKSQFLANMSHEIRTPLNAILGFSKELNDLSLTPDKQEQVRIINAAADNLLGIVNDVLDVSKIEAGKLQINNQPFSINQLLEEVVSVMAKSAHQRHLEFVFELQPLPEKLIGDVVRIRQILNNLLSNALKFTRTGHIKLSAGGAALEHGMYELQIAVSDTGIGISQQDRKKLFNAFSQVDDALSRNYQGTGLGLMITQQLVRLMRGNITLSSEPGEGSTFCVTLRVNLLNTNLHPTPSPDWLGKQVLLVDAYEPSRLASMQLLKCVGADVTAVAHLGQAPDLSWDVAITTISETVKANAQPLITELMAVSAAKRIVLHSSNPPVNEHLCEETRVRLPLTPNKLLGLLRHHQSGTPDPVKQSLMALPEARVLAVDDMEMNLLLLRTWLKDTPLAMTFAHSGAEAVELCEKAEFDLILMDVQMPNMDGLQASQLIRQTELNLGTPIIAVTAHAFKEEQERLLASGMDDYLPKPIELAELVTLIKRWCHQQEHQPVSLPIIDWQLALKRANQNVEGAREVLHEFTAQLPGAVADIQHAWQQQNFAELQQHVHKLHGACCYTGVPKLLNLCDEVEGYLKQQRVPQASERLPILLMEADVVRSEAQRLLRDLDEAPTPGFGNV